LKKSLYIVATLLFLFSCKSDQHLQFTEASINQKKIANIEVIYPKVDTNSEIASKINSAIESTISKNISFFSDDTLNIPLTKSIEEFEKRYLEFKTDFEDAAIKWDAIVNSEVAYQSLEVITIAIDSYVFTGGAHGNSVISLLNFNPATGDLYSQEDLLKNNSDLLKLVERYFKTEITKKQNENSENYFFGEAFKLPENIGFSDDGIIFLYNTYEATSYAQGITEFTIPYNEILKYLKINP
jgi:hypothetical protein